MVDLTCYSSYGILSGISAKVKVQNAISPPTSHHIAEDFLLERYEVIRAIKKKERVPSSMTGGNTSCFGKETNNMNSGDLLIIKQKVRNPSMMKRLVFI